MGWPGVVRGPPVYLQSTTHGAGVRHRAPRPQCRQRHGTPTRGPPSGGGGTTAVDAVDALTTVLLLFYNVARRRRRARLTRTTMYLCTYII